MKVNEIFSALDQVLIVIVVHYDNQVKDSNGELDEDEFVKIITTDALISQLLVVTETAPERQQQLKEIGRISELLKLDLE